MDGAAHKTGRHGLVPDPPGGDESLRASPSMRVEAVAPGCFFPEQLGAAQSLAELVRRVARDEKSRRRRAHVNKLKQIRYQIRREHLCAMKRAEHAADPEKARAQAREQYRRHRAKRLEQKKQYHAENRRRELRAMRARYRKNRAKRLAAQRLYDFRRKLRRAGVDCSESRR
jgi:hypothetical protein